MSTPTDSRNPPTRIADHIRAQIETGELKPGEQLPTIDDLATRYKCSAAPVRSAIELLQQQGLVVTRQGLGTFVRERPKARRHGIGRYSRSVWKADTLILTGEAAHQGLAAHQLIRLIGGARVNFFLAKFCGALVDFAGAKICGGTVGFGHAGFSGVPVNFTSAKFSGAEVNFSGSKFAAGLFVPKPASGCGLSRLRYARPRKHRLSEPPAVHRWRRQCLLTWLLALGAPCRELPPARPVVATRRASVRRVRGVLRVFGPA